MVQSFSFISVVLTFCIDCVVVGRLVRACSTQTAGLALWQRSCLTSGHVRSYCTSVLASCGTCSHWDKPHPEFHHHPHPIPRGPEPTLSLACKCSILKYCFSVPYFILCVIYLLKNVKLLYYILATFNGGYFLSSKLVFTLNILMYYCTGQ